MTEPDFDGATWMTTAVVLLLLVSDTLFTFPSDVEGRANTADSVGLTATGGYAGEQNLLLSGVVHRCYRPRSPVRFLP